MCIFFNISVEIYFQYEPKELLKKIIEENTHTNSELLHFEEFED